MKPLASYTSMSADLLGTLHDHAVNWPDRVAVIMLSDGENESERLTYAGLEQRVLRKAAALMSLGLQGQRVLLAEPPGVDFLVAFLACLRAGVVAVPVPDRPQGRWASQVLAIAADCEAAAVMAPMAWPALDLPLVGREVNDLSQSVSLRPPTHTDETVAYLQYTSGSTATPKGVMITFGNLAANQAMIMDAQALTGYQNNVVLSWLPPYHDMGLVGGILQPLLLGATSVLMPPLHMLARPLRWLKAIAHYRVAVSGGPNFAFQTCVERIKSEDLIGLDLSCWRLAYVGAEPVRLATLDAFASLLSSTGFERRAFYPCYGMAETVLFATGGEAGMGPFATDLGVNGGQEVTACGHAWSEAEVCVVDPLTHEESAEGVPGEIWIAGPHVAAGYWHRPDETQMRFKARLVGNSTLDFLRSGDRGVIRGGQLYVLGRLDDLIIVRGANHHPEDLEAQLYAGHPEVAMAVVFQAQRAGVQQLVVAVEIKRQAIAQTCQKQLMSDLAASLTRMAGLRADAVLLLRPGSVYRTSSGKPRRKACAEAYSQGTWPAHKEIEHGK